MKHTLAMAGRYAALGLLALLPTLAGAATDLAIGDATVIEGNAGTVTLDFPIVRGGDLTRAVSVNYRIEPGPAKPATPGVDTALVTGVAVLPAMQANPTLAIGVVGDVASESDEQLVVRILSAYEIDTPAYDAGVTFAIGSQPDGVTFADLDGDGRLDIITSNEGSATISVLRNQATPGSIGTTSFAPRQDFAKASGGSLALVQAADLDGDGILDVAASCQDTGQLSVFRGTSVSGAISFDPRQDFGTAGISRSLALADLDGDGALDAALGIFSGKVSVLRNVSVPGTIGFATKTDFAAGANVEVVTAGDFDADGRPELVVANAFDDTVSMFLNQATAGVLDATSFAAQVTFAVGDQPRVPAINDVDRDGQPDLVVGNKVAPISVLRNQSTPGALAFASKVDVGAMGSFGLAFADVDGDDIPDLVASNGQLFINASSPGTISFSGPVSWGFVANDRSVAIGDLDGDGKPDIAATSASGAHVLVARATATLATISDATGSGTIADDDTATGSAGLIRGGMVGPLLLLVFLAGAKMRRQAAARVLLLALVLVLMPPPARADRGVHGAAMAGVTMRDPNISVSEGYGAQALVGSELELGMRWELNAFAYRNTAKTTGEVLKSWGGGVDVVYPFRGRLLQPFVIAGVGIERDSLGSLAVGMENSPFWDLGIGATYPATAAHRFRGELRAYAVDFDVFPGSDWAYDFRLNLGMEFGGRSRPPPAPAPVAVPAAPSTPKVRKRRTR
ncbi:MAG TPA: FG-GAP-like repeat-containing protein [Candidatus Binatia bacterium]|nr:FG-GAP-like repeat-containing protein [Candidatus Binatia bacterium]